MESAVEDGHDGGTEGNAGNEPLPSANFPIAFVQTRAAGLP